MVPSQINKKEFKIYKSLENDDCKIVLQTFTVLNIYLASYDTPCSKIRQKLCLWGAFESLWESQKSSKITPSIIWQSVKKGISEIIIGLLKKVLLAGI